MNPTPVQTLILPLAAPMVLLLVLALYYRARDWMRTPRQRGRSIYQCQSCRHLYLLDRDVPMQPCPRCAHLNELVRR